MSLPRPIRPYHFQADLIWWDGPFKFCGLFIWFLLSVKLNSARIKNFFVKNSPRIGKSQETN